MNRYCLPIFLFFLLVILAGESNALIIAITVKESAGVNATNYPVTIGVPLANGACTLVNKFGIFDAQVRERTGSSI